MSRMFALSTLKTHWSLLPVVAITGFACGMCTTYVAYMMKTKPDLRFGKKENLPEMDVAPTDVRKLIVKHKTISYDSDIEKLKQELSNYK